MKKLTIGGKFDWFMDTLNKSGVFVRTLSDKEIETYIFEDLIVGAVSCFNKNNLKELKDDGIIDEEIEEATLLLREKILLIDNSDIWNIDSVKTDSNWLDIFELSDWIKKKVHEMWTDEELEYLKTI